MAFEWNPDLENQVFENWWSGTYTPQRTNELNDRFKKFKNKKYVAAEFRNNFSSETKAEIKTGKSRYTGASEWTSYKDSYLQTQVQQIQQQVEADRAAQQAERDAQQTLIVKAEQDYAAAAKQAEEAQTQAKRISTFSDYQGQQLVRQERQASALALQSQAQPVQQRKKTQIGQPGVSRTRVSSGIGIGGYGGTSAGNVNPTGLNI